ncbi:MAG: circularly permuted type 2 ATP-grasp protein [Bacteroidia bacterium]|nr:circularly permuted type 2 ATP-grasp protein [Bacteroidia bacterium]
MQQQQHPLAALLTAYQAHAQGYDEVIDAQGTVRPHYQRLYEVFSRYSFQDFQALNERTKLSFFNQGITFAVYSDESAGSERIFPFDLFPRIIPQAEWNRIEQGMIQRNTAINLFLHDLYHDKKILKDQIVPAELIFSSRNYNKHMIDHTPAGGIYNHISGTDLIRHKDGQYYILEDNIRCPSGVSYVLANREAMKAGLSDLFQECNVALVKPYPTELLSVIQSVAPETADRPTAVVLTPGMYNSAYFEHSFLAQRMGIELVEGRDLLVDQGFVYMKTIQGRRRVDVIYRRVDDEFLDPMAFRPDSLLGVPGLMSAYRAGNVTLVNAPGTGVADDKAVYAYLPEIIRYYLDEQPILLNVPTYRCEVPDERAYVFEHMDELVVKPVDESGGYGIVIGPQATKEQLAELRTVIQQHPRKYIAQPVMYLSTHATYIEETAAFEPRHIDLRVFSLMGKDRHYVLKGGLSRVALRRGSLIVNSSQGGGSKDTWVLGGGA